MYTVLAYFISRNIAELAVITFIPLLNLLIIYWMIELHPGAGYFFMYLLISLLASVAGSSYGLMISSFFKEPKAAVSSVPIVGLAIIAFGGYFKHLKDLPGWVGWIEYISPIRYAFIANATNEYRNTTAPIELLGLNMGITLSLVLLVVISVAARLIAVIVLSLSKTKL